jgi:hypothetical protein
MKIVIGYSLLTISAGLLSYFVYSLIWFMFIGRRAETARGIALAWFGYLAVIASAGLWASAWLWGRNWLVSDPIRYTRLLIWVGVALCFAAIITARFCKQRIAIPILMAASIVALNWIGSTGQ